MRMLGTPPCSGMRPVECILPVAWRRSCGAGFTRMVRHKPPPSSQNNKKKKPSEKAKSMIHTVCPTVCPGPFMTAFNDKGRMSSYVTRFPVHLVRTKSPAPPTPLHCASYDRHPFWP